ncbi:MAG: DUF4231 domain-containing protein [Nostocaceae cyanobacterium]|nr:DUF4231 domain-containing protein [Nostocaceae cyanobacterium]
MTSFEQNNQMEVPDIQSESSSASSQTMLSFLKVIEYFSLATFVGSAIINLLIPGYQRIAIIAAVSLAIFIFLFLINFQQFKASRQAAYKRDIQTKAQLYLMNNQNSLSKNPVLTARGKALEYAQELIEDYKRTRRKSRILYYGLQIGTIIFSGVTPILVLVDKLEAGQTWLKWLPVIFPAIASIVASVVTSFPFQENFISANTTVELLEAEQEKFLLGITPLYRCYDSVDENEQEQKAKQSIENFIIQVNNIHLKQVQETSQAKKKEEEEKTTQTAQQSNLSTSQQA